MKIYSSTLNIVLAELKSMCLEQLLQNKVRIKQGLVDLGGLPCDVDATVRASAKSFQS